jgi:hypothetical protein
MDSPNDNSLKETLQMTFNSDSLHCGDLPIFQGMKVGHKNLLSSDSNISILNND